MNNLGEFINRKYVVTYVLGCSDAGKGLGDVVVSICEGQSEADVIRKLIDIKHCWFTWFIMSFIACRESIGTPSKDFEKSEKILARIAKEYDELNLSSLDSEHPEVKSYVERNVDELVYLLELYEDAGCDYIQILPMSKCVWTNQ